LLVGSWVWYFFQRMTGDLVCGSVGMTDNPLFRHLAAAL
jgi:hypothetical protein